MTDTDKLKRLTEWHLNRSDTGFYNGDAERGEFHKQASVAILALIAENEALKSYGRDVAKEALQYRKALDRSNASEAP